MVTQINFVVTFYFQGVIPDASFAKALERVYISQDKLNKKELATEPKRAAELEKSLKTLCAIIGVPKSSLKIFKRRRFVG
ncbi:MAG: hypothetical protein AB8V23_00200 [Candidatus Midichloria sp.]|uniref:Uncharacterized protein n=1 Tax=Hyalomma marginatum TaxID=34627 RepID=A0A8S4C312_9ACAR|nr:hypothetical protein MHYMCMPSP_00097 [Hyalomma marginatum]CAG7595293.1 hypothetical protein MHYMCMPASI_00822 [Hyalomma marginatum]